MKILKEVFSGRYSIAICGLGFESRAITAFLLAKERIDQLFVLGYDEHTDRFSYKSNKALYEARCDVMHECSDDKVEKFVADWIDEKCLTDATNVMVDITVMSRHRLATVISILVDKLPKGSSVTVVYTLSEYVPPPTGVSPVKKVCEIANGFEGSLGDLSLPTTVILGLGYEEGKALGVSNYLEAWRDYLFIPRSPIPEFEELVRRNNLDLIMSTPTERTLVFSVTSPYSTYLDLRALVLELREISRPLLIPLGPKVFAALCVVLGKELAPDLPVWRVSSEYLEEPIDRPPSVHEIAFTIAL